MRITITRETNIPDRLKLERFKRVPELGPKVLFFSGGTALRGVSQEIINYTHNSIHIITPFDSGGSSAILRRTFSMPAVGDIRNRLMALADQSMRGNPEIFTLFAHRLDTQGSPQELLSELISLGKGKHELVCAVPDPMARIITTHFADFHDAMPPGFDLRGASLGNLVLTAGYLTNHCQLDPVIYLFSKLAQVCGVVRPVVDDNLHLAVELDTGEILIGQHRITGKDHCPLNSRIKSIWLTASEDDPARANVPLGEKTQRLISEAGLICYPMGSFYSSVLANLLPIGVGQAISTNRCPKVFVPSTGTDPETFGMSIADQVRALQATLTQDGAKQSDVLEYVLVDCAAGVYPGGLDTNELAAAGVSVIDCPLVGSGNGQPLDATLLTQALLSLA